MVAIKSCKKLNISFMTISTFRLSIDVTAQCNNDVSMYSSSIVRTVYIAAVSLYLVVFLVLFSGTVQ